MSMTPFRSATLMGLAMAAIGAAESSTSTMPTTVIVTGERPGDPLLPLVTAPEGRPAADAGARLRDVPGMAGIRMGGLGIDPVLRGQSGSRIQIITDGACPHGGCPNRMDPPTAYAPAAAKDLVVEPAGMSVRHAGAAGTVTLDRSTPRFADGRPVRAAADGRASSNGQAREAGADVAVGLPGVFARGVFHTAAANDYRDGDGGQVHSSYRTTAGGGTVGWTPSERTRLEASVDATTERDVAFAGASMDAPTSDGLTARLRFRTGEVGPFSRLSADAYRSDVDHEMDNYSLRPLGGMAMRAPTTSDTTGGRIDTVMTSGRCDVGLGLEAEDLCQDARRFSGPSATSTPNLNSVLWPDARITRVGAYGDATWRTDDRTRLTAGLRYDQVRSDARAADEDPPGMMLLSPNTLYRTYYGTSAEQRTEHLAGGVMRVDHGCSDHTVIGLALSRTSRAADPTERFIAGNGMPTAANRWVGNPGLEAESHHQVQAIATWREEGAGHLRGEAWVDRVHDFISRDRARGQEDILLADHATIYRNTEALLMGYGLDGAVDVRSWLELGSDAAWTWAKDLDRGAPLAQIPPLAGKGFLRLHHGDLLETTLTLRWSSRQERVDDDVDSGSAVDIGPTAGWGVLDWSVAWRPCAGGHLSAGIDNLSDRTYAEHLNKPSAFDPTVQRVNEPGRSYWVGGRVTF